MTDKTEQLVKECARQAESCKYTSAMLFIWLRWVRWYNRAFLVLPIILGSISTWNILKQSGDVWVAAICALLAGLLPAIYKALDLQTSVKSIAMLAAEFKNLQDRFRQAGEIHALGDDAAFSKQFDTLMKRLEDARKWSITPPEWSFKAAQKKINAGDYDFAVDAPVKS